MVRPIRFSAAALCIVLVSRSLAAQEPVDLFDGKTTSGWINPFEWGEVWVADGTIHLKGQKKFFLVTEKTYGDFVLEAEVLVPEGGNSGIQFRSHFQKNKLWGYQAEVDTSQRRWAGGFYDEGRRAWLGPLTDKPEAQGAFKNGQWNRYRIEAIGDRIRIWVNDILTADARDSVDIEGHIAIQHHGEKDLEYQFRNIRIKDLGRRKWQPLFNPADLSGWHTLAGGKWEIKDGVILGTSPATDLRHGQLVSDAKYRDFTVRLQYRATQGNSGLYFRVDESGDFVGVHGFQAEIDPDKDAGGLYETGGRAWVVQPTPEDVKKWYKPGEWNQMSVSAHGGNIVVHVNGFKTAQLTDDPGRQEGHLALQLHGGMEMRVEFKEVEILAADK